MTDDTTGRELTDPHHIRLIAHGTNGSDSIEPGIHLRWAFSHKLGFPDTFKLYRRTSDPLNHYQWRPSASTQAASQLSLPTSFLITSTPGSLTAVDVRFDSEEAQSFPIVSRTFLPHTRDALYIEDGELNISFTSPPHLPPISRIELGFLISSDSDFQLVGTDTYPQTLLGTFPGWKDVYFGADGGSGVTLRSRGINLFHVGVWLCMGSADPAGFAPGSGAWQLINTNCESGVPLDPATKPTPIDIDSVAPVVDVATIDCRLPNMDDFAPFNRDDILALADLLPLIFHEGVTEPHGWTLFEDDATAQDADQETAVATSIYEYLLAQSLFVPVARALDLYFIDNTNPTEHYDYLLETMWPQWNLRQLDFEITFDAYEIGQRFSGQFAMDDLLYVEAGAPEIVAAPDDAARTVHGLGLNGAVELRFSQPVSEVQLWLSKPAGSGDVVVTSWEDYHVTYNDKRILQAESGLLRLHADCIDSIRIEGGNATLLRLHYDLEPAPYFLQRTMICGVTQGSSPYPLEVPHGLDVSFLPGGPVNSPDLTHTDVPYLAGLRWETNEDPDIRLMPYHPFAYHVQRQLQNAPIELLTQDAPLLISPSTLDEHEVALPEGWPSERQFYIDNLGSTQDHYEYAICALDLFGRRSPFTKPVTYTVEMPPPPPPIGVTAHYLDYGTYNAATDSFTDPNISQLDADWLRFNQVSALVVRWQWPDSLALQAPDVDSFRVMLKEGWLNTYAGAISSPVIRSTVPKSSLNLRPSELRQYPLLDTYTDIPVYTFTVNMTEGAHFARNALRTCWLRKQNASFLILANTDDPDPELTVLRFEDPPEPAPVEGVGISISATADKTAYIDYTLPQNWHATDPLQHVEGAHKFERYTVYIPGPPFPTDPVTAENPVRYGQVGVCAVAAQVDGGVSTAATVMAVHQQPPTAPRMPAVADMATLKATAADVNGKSTFHVRWLKSGDSSVQHAVYRAMDTSLFLIDNARRVEEQEDQADYSSYGLPHHSQEDIDALKAIPKESDVELALEHYAELNASQLFMLANLPENRAAYTRLHGHPIYEGDSECQDRVTEFPVAGASYLPDPGSLLYSDTTLDGRGSNRYFYKIKTTGANGLSSEFGDSTLPVECPWVTAPPRPVITSVNGGESQITIRWAKNPGVDIAGYLLYRTGEKRFARDWRRMELVKADSADTFTVAVNGNLPAKEFEYVDGAAPAREPYYYAVVAVGPDETGRWLRSRLSRSVVGQAYKLTPPEPPIITSATRIDVDGEQKVVVAWQSGEPLTCMLKRRDPGSSLTLAISEWIDIGVLNEASGLWEYEYEDTEHISSIGEYVYAVAAVDRAGNFNTSEEFATA